jgi:serine O-acetyltransferase
VDVPEREIPLTSHLVANGDAVLGGVVEQLCTADHGLARRRDLPASRRILPARAALVEAVELLRTVMFPGYHGNTEVSDQNVRFHVGAALDQVSRIVHEQVRRGLCFACERKKPIECGECEERAASLSNTFLMQLPEVRRLLATDVQAAYEGDPAASSPDEAILCYPGIVAMLNHRLAHELYRLDVPLLPRIISEHAHSTTGIDLHPGAQVDEFFFIDHGTGVVIGETAVIGKRVRIYQGVTLGAKSFPLDENGNPIKGIPRHPIVEDDVTIYGGATILGRVTIGRGTVIGGNVWLTRGTDPGSKITQAAVRHEAFSDGAGI